MNDSPDGNEEVYLRIKDLLEQRGAPFDVKRHEAVFTSEQAAQVRGSSLASGAKSLLCKADGEFMLFVMPANLKLDSNGFRKEQGCRKLRFASPDELLELTGLKPGSVPPFGSLFSLKTYCDRALAEQSEINFNAGHHCISLSMTFEAYQQAEQPVLCKLAKS